MENLKEQIRHELFMINEYNKAIISGKTPNSAIAIRASVVIDKYEKYMENASEIVKWFYEVKFIQAVEKSKIIRKYKLTEKEYEFLCDELVAHIERKIMKRKED